MPFPHGPSKLANGFGPIGLRAGNFVQGDREGGDKLAGLGEGEGVAVFLASLVPDTARSIWADGCVGGTAAGSSASMMTSQFRAAPILAPISPSRCRQCLASPSGSNA